MSYYISMVPFGEDDIQHYGVLGMKCGVRKDPAKAYEKAKKHKRKLENRIVRANSRVARYERKAISQTNKVNHLSLFPQSPMYKMSAKKLGKINKRLHQYRLSQARASSKAIRFTHAMEDVFKDIPLSELENRQN